MGCCCSKSKAKSIVDVKSKTPLSNKDDVNHRQPMTISPMTQNIPEVITTEIPFSSPAPKEDGKEQEENYSPKAGNGKSGIRFEDLKSHDLTNDLTYSSPYVDDSGLDDLPTSLTSSQARNLGPLIAARMKRETASSQLKKTVGLGREVGLKSSASGLNAFNRTAALGPESRVGYMSKQGQRLRKFKKSYFILSNGVLMDFDNEMDSLNNSKISERSDKSIYLKGYKLISIQNKNHLILEIDETLSPRGAGDKPFIQNTTIDDMGRDSMDLIQTISKQRSKYVFEIKDHTQYLLWQNAFQAHLTFVNRSVSDRSGPPLSPK